ncbi:MAG: HXXEE domain-containing protein [Bacteroidales bacterium]|mgnify:CR=1|nr:HXXEE domain-containing protein [Bacteroidales bacterium]
MFSILFHISLPLVFLLHSAEELFDRSQRQVTAIVLRITAFSLILVSVLFALCEISLYPLLAASWAFYLHLPLHCGQSLFRLKYTPGLVTALLLIPYACFVASDLLRQLDWRTNLLLAAAGIILICLLRLPARLFLKSRPV